MEIQLLKIKLPAEQVAEILANRLIEMELDDVCADGEFAQKFDISEVLHVHDYCHLIELFFDGAFGGLFSDTTGIGEQPTSELIRRYMYDSKLSCYILGEEVEINFGEIQKLIDKKIGYEKSTR